MLGLVGNCIYWLGISLTRKLITQDISSEKGQSIKPTGLGEFSKPLLYQCFVFIKVTHIQVQT